MNKGVAQLV